MNRLAYRAMCHLVTAFFVAQRGGFPKNRDFAAAAATENIASRHRF